MTTTAKTTKPKAEPGPADPGPDRQCRVVRTLDGGAVATLRIDHDLMRRIERRADKADQAGLEDWLWENVFKRALSGMAFTGGI